MPIRFLDEEPSPTQAFQQGLLIEGPANLASLLDLAASINPARKIQQEAIAAGLAEPPESFADRTRNAMTDLVQRSLGSRVRTPETSGGRLLESAGAGVTEALPFALIPGGGSAALAGRAATEISSGVLSETARRAAEQLGLGPLSQFGISLAAGIVPGTLGRGIATRLGPILSRRIRNRTARRIAREALGAPIDDRTEAIRLLQEEVDRPLFGQASVSQTLVGRFPRIEGVNRRVLRSGLAGDDLGNEAVKLRLSQAEATRSFAESSFPGGNPNEAISRYQDALERVQRKVKRAYAKVGDLEGIPTRRIKASAAAARVDADDFTGDLPSEVLSSIDGYGETTNLKKLQRLRTKLGEEVRKADKAGDLQKARYARQIRDSVDATLDEVAELGGSSRIRALRRANQIRRLEELRFGEQRFVSTGKRIRVVQDPLNQMLGSNPQDLDKAFVKFLNSDPQAARVLERTRLTLGDNPKAWGGVQELMNRQVFGPDFDLIFENRSGVERIRRGVSQPLRNLRKYKASFEAVHGEGSAARAEEFLRRAEKLGQGVAGRVDEFFVSGSNIADNETKLLQRSILADMASGTRHGWARAGMKAWRLATGQLPDSLEEADILLAQALTDPPLAKAFLEELDPQAIALWRHRAQLFVNNPIRSAAGVSRRER